MFRCSPIWFLFDLLRGRKWHNWIVVDSVTNERLQGVKVRMVTHNGQVEETATDFNGYFEAIVFVSCDDFTSGGKNCTDFTAEFEIENYQSLKIDEYYYDLSDTEFIGEKPNDTLVIKLDPRD